MEQIQPNEIQGLLLRYLLQNLGTRNVPHVTISNTNDTVNQAAIASGSHISSITGNYISENTIHQTIHGDNNLPIGILAIHLNIYINSNSENQKRHHPLTNIGNSIFTRFPNYLKTIFPTLRSPTPEQGDCNEDYLGETFITRYKNTLRTIFPLLSDDYFLLFLEGNLVPLLLKEENLSNWSTNNDDHGKRIGLFSPEMKYSQKLLKKMTSDILNTGSCIYFETAFCRLLIELDISKCVNRLENDSLENVLLNFIGLDNIAQTENFIRKSNKFVFCFLSGYEYLPAKAKTKVDQFLTRDVVTNSTIFRFSNIILSLPDSPKYYSKKFLSSFDQVLTLRGVTLSEYNVLFKKLVEKDDEWVKLFHDRLKKLNLSFLIEMSPLINIGSCNVYNTENPDNTFEFLDNLLNLVGSELIKQLKTNGFTIKAEYDIQSVWIRIGEVLFRKLNDSSFTELSFERKDFDEIDLQIASELELLLTRDQINYKIAYSVLLDYLVVKYLNHSLGVTLEDRLPEFNRWSKATIQVLTATCEGGYFIKSMSVTPTGMPFTLALIKDETSLNISYYIARDFKHQVKSSNCGYFTVDLSYTSCVEDNYVTGSILNYLTEIVPISFTDEHLIKTVGELCPSGFNISIKYPLRDGANQSSITDLVKYSYHLEFDNKRSLVYTIRLGNEDFIPINSFVKGIYQMLSVWPENVNFRLTENQLYLSCDHLKFGDRVMRVAYETELCEGSNDDDINIIDIINSWRLSLNEKIPNWVLQIGDNIIDRRNKVNIDALEVNSSNILGLVVKY